MRKCCNSASTDIKLLNPKTSIKHEIHCICRGMKQSNYYEQIHDVHDDVQVLILC